MLTMRMLILAGCGRAGAGRGESQPHHLASSLLSLALVPLTARPAEHRATMSSSKPSRSATPAERQAAALSRLLSNPDREVRIPERPQEGATKSLRAPRDMMKNVQGSSAGAGSGEFVRPLLLLLFLLPASPRQAASVRSAVLTRSPTPSTARLQAEPPPRVRAPQDHGRAGRVRASTSSLFRRRAPSQRTFADLQSAPPSPLPPRLLGPPTRSPLLRPTSLRPRPPPHPPVLSPRLVPPPSPALAISQERTKAEAIARQQAAEAEAEAKTAKNRLKRQRKKGARAGSGAGSGAGKAGEGAGAVSGPEAAARALGGGAGVAAGAGAGAGAAGDADGAKRRKLAAGPGAFTFRPAGERDDDDEGGASSGEEQGGEAAARSAKVRADEADELRRLQEEEERARPAKEAGIVIQDDD